LNWGLCNKDDMFPQGRNISVCLEKKNIDKMQTP
jgi:hypothetical protein